MKNKKSALITGGAKRIGKAIALDLAQNGYDIALHYNTSYKEAKKVLKQVEKLGRKCVLFKCDLNKTSDVLKLIKKVKEIFPSLNLLINNASIFKEGKILENELPFFDHHFNINLKAPIFLSRDFARVSKTGYIINILDTNITRKRTKNFAYNLSKKMLYEFTMLAASEFAPNIRVNAIAPGPILPPQGKGMKYLLENAKKVPLKRKGELTNIVQTVNFLLENDYITGQCIFVDGGDHLR